MRQCAARSRNETFSIEKHFANRQEITAGRNRCNWNRRQQTFRRENDFAFRLHNVQPIDFHFVRLLDSFVKDCSWPWLKLVFDLDSHESRSILSYLHKWLEREQRFSTYAFRNKNNNLIDNLMQWFVVRNNREQFLNLLKSARNNHFRSKTCDNQYRSSKIITIDGCFS